MRPALLFLVFISCLECVSAKEPSIYIQLSWDMSWTRLCDLLPLFAKKLSGELYELGTLRLVNFEVNVNRIRFMNDKAHCEGSRSTQVAVLDFFISKSEMDLGNSDVDGNITILAYTKLHDYWRNNKMHLLDAVFLEKVDKVELMGKDKPDIPEEMTESTRVAIGIVVGLVIAFGIAIVTVCLAARRQIKGPAHGVPIEELPEPKIMMRDEVDQTAGYYHYGGDDRQHEFPTIQDTESYNRYAVQDHMKYDDEPLGSPML